METANGNLHRKLWGSQSQSEQFKVFPVQAMNAYRGSKGKAPLILNLSTRWKWVVRFTPGRFTPGKEPRCPMNTKLGGSQSRSGRFRKQVNLFPLLSIELRFLGHPVHSLFTIPARMICWVSGFALLTVRLDFVHSAFWSSPWPLVQQQLLREC